MSEENIEVHIQSFDPLAEEQPKEDAPVKTEFGGFMGEMLEKIKTEDINKIEAPDVSKMFGGLFGDAFSKVSNMVSAPKKEGQSEEEHMSDLMKQLFGEDMAAKMQKATEVKKFFEDVLRESSFAEAICLTKEKYDLPDDYSFELKLRVTFSKSEKV